MYVKKNIYSWIFQDKSISLLTSSYKKLNHFILNFVRTSRGFPYQIFCGVNMNSRTSLILFVLCSNKPNIDVFWQILYLELTS